MFRADPFALGLALVAGLYLGCLHNEAGGGSAQATSDAAGKGAEEASEKSVNPSPSSEPGDKASPSRPGGKTMTEKEAQAQYEQIVRKEARVQVLTHALEDANEAGDDESAEVVREALSEAQGRHENLMMRSRVMVSEELEAEPEDGVKDMTMRQARLLQYRIEETERRIQALQEADGGDEAARERQVERLQSRLRRLQMKPRIMLPDE